MKSWLPLVVLCIFGSITALTREERGERKPNQASDFVSQVQVCEGTEALGNEGQGAGASALVNVYVDPNTSQKKCDLGLAYGYEYGNTRGLKLGRHQLFNIFPVSIGQTECVVKEESGEILITIKKAMRQNSKRTPKILVENCKLTASGN